MRKMIWWFACVGMTACTAGQPLDGADRSASTSAVSAAAASAAETSDSEAAIHEPVIAASAPACHGTTTCPTNAVFVSSSVADCGPQECGGPPCPAKFPNRTQLVQPQEQATNYAVGSFRCVAFTPLPPRVLSPPRCGVNCPL